MRYFHEDKMDLFLNNCDAANKALQLDNLRGVACVHARCAPILAHKRHRINCD